VTHEVGLGLWQGCEESMCGSLDGSKRFQAAESRWRFGQRWLELCFSACKLDTVDWSSNPTQAWFPLIYQLSVRMYRLGGLVYISWMAGPLKAMCRHPVCSLFFLIIL